LGLLNEEHEHWIFCVLRRKPGGAAFAKTKAPDELPCVNATYHAAGCDPIVTLNKSLIKTRGVPITIDNHHHAITSIDSERFFPSA